MNCPKCGAGTLVQTTKEALEGAFVRRSRLCKGCWLHFKTREVPETGDYDALLPVSDEEALDLEQRTLRAAALHAVPSASRQDGYFTTADAQRDGCSAVRLCELSARGAVVRLARGVYRVAPVPASTHERVVVAWLWTGRVGVATHQTALELHGLLEPTTSPFVHLAVPHGWRPRRRAAFEGVVLNEDDVAPDPNSECPVPVVTAARALAQCAATRARRAHVLLDLAQVALKRGLCAAPELVAEGQQARPDVRKLLQRACSAVASA